MQKGSQAYDEQEFNLDEFIDVVEKRKKIFIATFLLILAAGFVYIQLSPKIYKIAMLIQPPVSGESLSGASDVESAESLRGLIISNAFNEELIKKLKLNVSPDALKFSVFIPAKTNVLEVSTNLGSKDLESGITLLNGLSDVIFESYAKRIDADNFEILNKIEQNKRLILSTEEKIKNFKEQGKELSLREQRLMEEIKVANANTAQVLARREELLKNQTSPDSTLILLLTNFLQNDLNFLNQMNNQLSDLSIRRTNLNTEIKNLELAIIDFQATIDKLSKSKKFISNIRIVSQPRPSLHPVSPDRNKILALSIFVGCFFGLLVVFMQEFWQKHLSRNKG